MKVAAVGATVTTGAVLVLAVATSQVGSCVTELKGKAVLMALGWFCLGFSLLTGAALALAAVPSQVGSCCGATKGQALCLNGWVCCGV